jgi:hypothetical protein
MKLATMKLYNITITKIIIDNNISIIKMLMMIINVV